MKKILNKQKATTTTTKRQTQVEIKANTINILNYPGLIRSLLLKRNLQLLLYEISIISKYILNIYPYAQI